MNSMLIKLRNESKMNQTEFANKIGLSQSGYSLIENGKRELNERIIKIICNEFDINEDWLKTGKGRMHKHKKNKKSQLQEIIKDFSLEDLEKINKFMEILIEMKKEEKLEFDELDIKFEGQAEKENKPLTKEELDELEIQKELAEFEEAVRTQKNRDKNNLLNINYLENTDYFKEKKPA